MFIHYNIRLEFVNGQFNYIESGTLFYFDKHFVLLIQRLDDRTDENDFIVHPLVETD